RADDHRDRPVAIGPVARARGFADDLVEGGVDEVGELDLRDRDEPVEGGADGDADDAGFSERCIEHAGLAKLRVEAFGGPENSTFAPDVLAQHKHALVALHLLRDGTTHTLTPPHFPHASISN